MASSKDILATSRPLTHRPSPSSNSLTGINVGRQSHSRTNSHTNISSPLNAVHRVARRKSVSNNTANMVAAAAAAGIGETDKVPALPIAINNRRKSKSGGLRPELTGLGGLPSPPASMPAHKFLNMEGKPEHQESAIEDQESASPDEGESAQKARVRRASDGQPLTKEGRKFNRPELRCEHCGKGYKHSSCLTKHLWEHTPEWSYTSKLLISKHQQVQLLEAASVLLAMNNQPTSPPDSARETSPSVSGGFSEQMDDHSSAYTTPPPQLEAMHSAETSRYYFSPISPDSDGLRSALSRSLQPVASDNFYATSMPSGSGFGHLQQYLEPSPPPAGSSVSGETDSLAKAYAKLSCSHGSNNGGSLANQLPLDIPPVPPVPAHFLGQASLGQSPFLNSFPNQAPESFTRGDRRQSSDVKMEDVDDDDDMRSRSRSDDDEYGFFGRMEE